MKRPCGHRVCAVAWVLVGLLALGSFAHAEDIVGKWRVEVHVGGLNPGDSIPSNANSEMTVLLQSNETISVSDPRAFAFTGESDDLSLQPLGLNEAEIQADPRIDLRAGYGFYAWKNTELYVDFGIGYYTQEIVDVELAYSPDGFDPQYQGSLTIGDPTDFDDDDATEGLSEVWRGELIRAGELRMFPVSVNFLARFRPTKRLNPYIGGGLGYYFVEFNPSSRWVEVADALDQACVTYVDFPENQQPALGARDLTTDPLSPNPGSPCYQPPHWSAGPDDPELVNYGHDLKRPQIETPDTSFLEARAGVEWQWKPKIALFTDVRFTWAAKEVRITADGREQFGEGVPTGTFDEPPVPRGGKPAYISYYRGIEDDSQVKTTVGGPGEYFLNGGTLDYGGWHFSAGIRFTL